MAYLRAHSLVVLTALVGGLVAAWAVSYRMGGSYGPFPHLFYLPIILAAVRSSWFGALATAFAAGLLAGPALPENVALGVEQSVESWVLRLAIFVTVSALVVALTRGRSESLGMRFQDRLTSNRLVRAIQRGEVEVHYQPICDAAGGWIVGVEALSRWNAPGDGMVPPADFIPQAERTGAIAVLDRFVLREAVRQAQVWSDNFTPVDVSVNVSAAWFADLDLVTEVRDVLTQTGLAPEHLQLEITESAVIGDVAAARRQVAELRKLGVGVAIDDFGTGQSSLSYLDQFAVDTIKIDRSLVAPISSRTGSGRLVDGIIRFLQTLDLNVVAEGVETAEQYAQLRSMGCPRVQGYHLGRPSPAAAIDGALRAEHTIRQERARALADATGPVRAVPPSLGRGNEALLAIGGLAMQPTSSSSGEGSRSCLCRAGAVAGSSAPY